MGVTPDLSTPLSDIKQRTGLDITFPQNRSPECAV
uniref:Uncharacterized protein n=1 Tax=Anguilla anguilla TaxID=7936 RepID=A0A0E9TPZ2_ANGAN